MRGTKGRTGEGLERDAGGGDSPSLFGLFKGLPFVVLLLGSLFTAFVGLELGRQVDTNARIRFERLVDLRVLTIERKLDAHIGLLRGAAGLFAATEPVSADGFRAYVARLRLLEYYPGVQGIGFARRIGEGDAVERTQIEFLEPLDRRNQAAIGFDMFAEPIRRAAMEKARDTATSALSGAVRLVQEIDGEKQPGFLIYTPVYEAGTIPATVEERRRRLIGWVYSPFRAWDLFRQSDSEALSGVDLDYAVYDGETATPASRLFPENVSTVATGLTRARAIEIAGRRWMLVAWATPAFTQGLGRELVPWVFAAGFAVTIGLTGAMLMQARARRLAEEASLALHEETRRLDALNRAGVAMSAELDPERLVSTVIEAATGLTGAAYGAFFERVPAGREGSEEVWRLFSLSGAPREAFTRFGLPRATKLFTPTFRTEGVVRCDDVLADPRYGSLGGMPKGHLPVRSYLAVPVLSSSGESLGALLFGHPEPRRFGRREEDLIVGFAAQAAIALDNARLFKAAQDEIERRRRVEAELAAGRVEAERRALERDAILGQLAEGVIVSDAEGRITFVNASAARLHGVERLDVGPDGYADAYNLLTEDGRPHPTEDLPLVRAVLKNETVRDARWRIRRPDGTEVVAIGSAQPLLSARGVKTGAVLTVRDDTARDAAERALRALNETLEARVAERTADLERARAVLQDINRNLEEIVAARVADVRAANEEIQRFAYVVSHDLRSPLVNIMGFTSELENLFKDIEAELALSPRRDDIERDFAESIGFIKTAIGKMDGLINAILRLSREGRREFRPERLDMAALLRALVDANRHQADEAEAEIVVGEVPDVVADRLAVEQIFGNLVDNAIKYLDPARPGRIEITGRQHGAFIRYAVCDNGRGIARQDFDRVFDLFRRAGRQDKPGEGIGLAHVRTLVRSLGGRVELTSEVGVGSTFVITLPAEPVLPAGSQD